MIHRQRFWPEDPSYVPQIYGYGRVSHHKQFEKGASVEDQEARIKAYLAMRLLEPDGPFTKSVFARMVVEPKAQSAFTKPLRSRPAGSELFEILQPTDHVIVDKFDRISRDTEDFLSIDRHFLERGIRLHIVNMSGASLDTGTAMGRFMAVHFALHAEFESAIKGERVRDARARLRAKGTDAGVGLPAFVRLEGLPEGKKSGSGSKRVFKDWAIGCFERLKALRETGLPWSQMGPIMVAEYPHVFKSKDRTSLEQKLRYFLHFWEAWNAAGQPDLNELKFQEFVKQYLLKKKQEGKDGGA